MHEKENPTHKKQNANRVQKREEKEKNSDNHTLIANLFEMKSEGELKKLKFSMLFVTSELQIVKQKPFIFCRKTFMNDKKLLLSILLPLSTSNLDAPEQLKIVNNCHIHNSHSKVCVNRKQILLQT